MTVPVLVVSDTSLYLPTLAESTIETADVWRAPARSWVPWTGPLPVIDHGCPQGKQDGEKSSFQPLAVGDVVSLAEPCPEGCSPAWPCPTCGRPDFGGNAGHIWPRVCATVTEILPVHYGLPRDLRPHLSVNPARPDGVAWWNGDDWLVSDPDNLIPGDWSSADFGIQLGDARPIGEASP